MSDTKADNSKDAAVQTLLHYLVRVLLKTAPMLLDFKNELPHLQAAAKCKPVSSPHHVTALAHAYPPSFQTQYQQHRSMQL